MTHLNTISGNPVTRAAFGAMQFGGTATQRDCEAMFQSCLEHGIAHFDTAWAYTEGRSEEILGQLVGKCRDDLYVASKVGYVGGAGRSNITEQFDQSRRRLQLDQIDLLYLHRFDPDTSLQETLETFAQFQSGGLVRHIGLSNFAAWQVMKAIAIARDLGTRIDVIQPMYNLVKRQAEVELLPMCADQGILACTYSPLGGGLLTGKYSRGGQGRLRDDDRYAARYGQDAMHRAAEKLTLIANRENQAAATLAVAWVLARGKCVHPIVSARNAAQLEPSLAALSYVPEPALLDELNALIPAPPPATDRIEEA